MLQVDWFVAVRCQNKLIKAILGVPTRHFPIRIISKLIAGVYCTSVARPVYNTLWFGATLSSFFKHITIIDITILKLSMLPRRNKHFC